MNFIRSGFRTVRQYPALIFGEIAWRWAFGFAAWLLVIFTLRTIMLGIDVSGAEIALAHSNNAYLIADAIIRVLAQVLPRFAAAMLLLVPALALMWTLAATIGRTATLAGLLARRPAPSSHTAFLSQAERSAGDASPQRRSHVFRLFLLNSLRALFTLATFLAFIGTVVFVSARMPSQSQPQSAPLYVLGWLFLAFVVGCLWGLVNWFLALAPIFIAAEGLGVGKAIAASLALYRERRKDYLPIATWFGVFRGAALLVALVAGSMTVAVSLRAGLIASIVIALIYFAIADWFYIARLAAYVELAVRPVLPLPVTEVPEVPANPAPSSDVSHLELES